MPIMDLRGDWTITQSQGSVVKLNLDQQVVVNRPVVLTGRASHDNGSKTSTDLQGTLRGDGESSTLVLVIKWSHGPIGEYHGTFGPFVEGGSRLTGMVFDQTSPASHATWTAAGKLFNFGPWGR